MFNYEIHINYGDAGQFDQLQEIITLDLVKDTVDQIRLEIMAKSQFLIDMGRPFVIKAFFKNPTLRVEIPYATRGRDFHVVNAEDLDSAINRIEWDFNERTQIFKLLND